MKIISLCSLRTVSVPTILLLTELQHLRQATRMGVQNQNQGRPRPRATKTRGRMG